jgi:hypothetical protein
MARSKGVFMRFVNEAAWDRILRVVLGAGLLALSWGGVIGGTGGTVLKVVGFIPLLTGVIGWCPLYALFHFRTNRSVTV